jgi:hypothetical protein
MKQLGVLFSAKTQKVDRFAVVLAISRPERNIAERTLVRSPGGQLSCAYSLLPALSDEIKGVENADHCEEVQRQNKGAEFRPVINQSETKTNTSRVGVEQSHLKESDLSFNS